MKKILLFVIVAASLACLQTAAQAKALAVIVTTGGGLTSYPVVGSAFKIRGFHVMPTWATESLTDVNGIAALKQLKGDGATWVGFDPQWFQTTSSSSDANATNSPYSVPDFALETAIITAHALGFKVMLKPTIESVDGTYRGVFTPSDTNAWFKTLDTFLSHYGYIAQKYQVDMFVIGTEYNSLDGPDNLNHWKTIIAGARNMYKGPITYAANWSNVGTVQFWNLLDYIGCDAYFPFRQNGNNPSLQYLTKQWNTVSSDPWTAEVTNYQTPVNYLSTIAAKYKKQVIFTEMGYGSSRQAYVNPGDSAAYTPKDEIEQQNDYEAFFETFGNRTDGWFAGVMFWNWEPANQKMLNSYPWYKTTMTPQGKTAETTVIHWFTGTAR